MVGLLTRELGTRDGSTRILSDHLIKIAASSASSHLSSPPRSLIGAVLVTLSVHASTLDSFRMMLRWGSATLLFVSALASASDASADRQRFCFDACRQSLAAVQFQNPENVTDPFISECVNHLRLESLYLCADTRCGASSRDEGLKGLNGTCQDLGVSLPGLDIIEKYKEEDISGLLRYNATNPGREHILSHPALPTDGFLELWMKTLVCFLANKTT